MKNIYADIAARTGGNIYIGVVGPVRTGKSTLIRRLMELSEDCGHFVRCIDLNGTAIGLINDVEITCGTIELGYAIHPDYHNQGLMTKALSCAIAELFKAGYGCVVCGAFEENLASIRVMEKCGMTPMSHTDTVEYRGISHNCVYYRITK